MLPRSPCKSVLSSPHHQHQHNYHWRPSPGKRRSKVVGALLADWSEEQVKSSSTPGSKASSRHAAGAQDDDTRRAARPLSFHEWKQQKQQAVAATTGGFVAGGMAAAAGSAEATTGLPQVLEPFVLEPQAVSQPASSALIAENSGASLQSSDLLQRVPAMGSSPGGAVQEGRVMMDEMKDLVLHNPEAVTVNGQATQGTIAHQISAPANTPIGLLSAAPASEPSSSMQGTWSSISSAASNASSSAAAVVRGSGGGGIEQGAGNEGVRRSVLEPLESAVGFAVSDAWQSATERLAAAIDEQLPAIEDVPGGEQLQGVLEGVKQLGSQLSSQMHSAWPTSPTLTKVLAYLAASFGLLLLIRAPNLSASQPKRGSKSSGPPAMITPRSTASARTDSVGEKEGANGANGGGGGGGGKRGLWDEAGALGGMLSAIVGEWQQGTRTQMQGAPQGTPSGPDGSSKTTNNSANKTSSSSANNSSGANSSSTRGISSSSGSSRGSEKAVGGGAARSAWAPRIEGEGQRMQDQEQARGHLKRLLREANKSLGPIASLMPVGQYEPLRREMDTLMYQLERASGRSAGSGTNAPGGNNSRRKSSNSVSSSVNSPQAAEWSGSGLGVAQWDAWERKTGPNEWDSRTPTGLKPPASDPRMLGAWELSYVSLMDLQLEEEEGGWLPPATSMMAFVMQVMTALPGFGIDQVVQHLWEDPSVNGSKAMASTATFRLGPLGSLRLCARGGWRERRRQSKEEALSHAVAWFETLGVQPLSLLGLAPEEGLFPEVVVPLPSDFQQPTEFLTTYLDADSRITRAASGAYLFRKLPPASKGALLAPA